MKSDETNPHDWLMAGKSRLQSADRLLGVEGSSPAVIELLQEAVERYLKGYLISRNWLCLSPFRNSQFAIRNFLSDFCSLTADC